MISYSIYKIINYLYTLHISYIREIIIYIIMVQWSITLKSHFLNFGSISNVITMYLVLCRVVVKNWIFHHRCHESFCKPLKKSSENKNNCSRSPQAKNLKGPNHALTLVFIIVDCFWRYWGKIRVENRISFPTMNSEHPPNLISTYLVFQVFRRYTYLYMAPNEKWYNNDGSRDVWTQMFEVENDMALKSKWVFVLTTENGF